jgi:hypothetical protein
VRRLPSYCLREKSLPALTSVFDGHLVDFDEAIERSSMYRPFEREKHVKPESVKKRCSNYA